MDRDTTTHDLDRIYNRLDDLGVQVANVALAQTQTATILSGLKDSLDVSNRDRAETCPIRSDVRQVLAVAYAMGGRDDPVGGTTDLVNRVDTIWGLGKWVGGIMAVAVLVPGVAWIANWVVKAIAAAIAGQ